MPSTELVIALKTQANLESEIDELKAEQLSLLQQQLALLLAYQRQLETEQRQLEAEQLALSRQLHAHNAAADMNEE